MRPHEESIAKTVDVWFVAVKCGERTIVVPIPRHLATSCSQ